jgi:two-component system, sensor histidine kinase PdtaS
MRWLLLFLLLSVHLCAQDPEQDSLKLLLREQVQDTHRVNTLLKLAWMIRYDDPSQSMNYSREALSLSSKLNFLKGKAMALSTIGVLQYRGGNLPAATASHQQALRIREQIGDENGVGRSMLNLGNIYSDMGDTALALENYFGALKIFEQENDKTRLINICINIGGIYLARNQNQQASVFCNRAYHLAVEINDRVLQAEALNNAGVCYEHLGLNDSALWAYKESYRLAEEEADKVLMVDAGINIGNVYRAQKDYTHAIEWHSGTVEIAKEIGFLEGLRGLYEQLAEDYRLTGDYKNAYESEVLFKKYSDTIYNEDNASRLVELTEQLAAERKELEMKRMEVELEQLNQQKKASQLYLVAGLIGFAVVVAAIIFSVIYINNRRRDQLIIEAQQDQLHYFKPRT